MIWTLNEPCRGDMIRVKLGSIYHYGIFVSPDEVIQFGLPPSARPSLKDSEVEVLSSDIETFLQGGFVERAEYDKKERKTIKSVEEIVKTAKSRIGEKGYSILYNNCEHFCYQVVFGKSFSSQTDNVRKLFHSMPILDVYIATIPENGKLEKVYPKLRQKEISACKNETVKKEKYYAWKLLEYALFRTFGLKIQDQKFEKTDNGKWICENFEFSISHSYSQVAVAISRDKVGVDIELLKARKTEKLSEKILTDTELDEFNGLSIDEKDEFIILKWSEKESLFKMAGDGVFSPKSLSPSKDLVNSQIISLNGENFALSISSKHLNKLRLYQNINL